MIIINDYKNLQQAEIDAMQTELNKNNYVLYDVGSLEMEDSKDLIRKWGDLFDLGSLNKNLCADSDSITPIAVSEQKDRGMYIPYSNRAINWHTDGYYNLDSEKITGMVLHCISPADTGGSNKIINHQVIYDLMLDKNPAYIDILSQNDVMTIPANIKSGKIIRPERTGAVFSYTSSGRLHMRYTARKTNIKWHPDAVDAIKYLNELLANPKKSKMEQVLLKSGQGLICYNILHTRDSFEDTNLTSRMILRGRYYS